MAGTVHYDDEARTYYADCNWSETAPSMRVIEVVATALDGEAIEIPQLYDSVDPDALDLLVGTEGSANGNRSTTVRFEHAGCHITVTTEGRIAVRPTAD